MKKNKDLIEFVRELAKKKIANSEQFLDFKKKLISRFKIQPPTTTTILEIYRRLKIKRNPYFENKLIKRPVRSLSGVAVVAVLTKPYPCPGSCLYCPIEKGIPKSYLSGEPAVERAKKLKYDPFNQVQKRIEVLEKNGHPTDKIELIVIGGTWSYLPKIYQTWFIKRCFDGANATDNKKPATTEPQNATTESQNGPSASQWLQGSEIQRLQEKLRTAQHINESAKHRIVGITLETRPDYITPQEIKQMRKLGCTRVELGVQTIEEKILRLNQRGHGVQQIIDATRLLKNAGFKVCYHLMPGLLGSNPKKDLAVFQKILSQADYRPDMIKIYPCVVTKGSKLYKLWRQKKYHPYSDKKLIDLLVKIKSIIPPHVRVIRMIRDIPSYKIEGGSKISNLREVVHQEMARRGLGCRCIRCREIKDLRSPIKNLKFISRHFPASEGQEFFLSFENIHQDKLVAFLRLRLPATTNYESDTNIRITNQRNLYRYFPALKDAAIIREIHTYGALVPIGQRKKASQHLGLGKKLIHQAELIAKNNGYKKIAVISGVGVRNYYRQLGYRLKDTYMVKNL